MGNRLLGTDKDVEVLVREARKAGWVVSIDGSTHIRWQAPDGGEFRSPLTGGPSCARRVRRNLARLDPCGFGSGPPPAPAPVDLAGEIAAAVEELLETAALLEAVAADGGPGEAARILRTTRNVLRDCEEALWRRDRDRRA